VALQQAGTGRGGLLVALCHLRALEWAPLHGLQAQTARDYKPGWIPLEPGGTWSGRGISGRLVLLTRSFAAGLQNVNPCSQTESHKLWRVECRGQEGRGLLVPVSVPAPDQSRAIFSGHPPTAAGNHLLHNHSFHDPLLTRPRCLAATLQHCRELEQLCLVPVRGWRAAPAAQAITRSCCSP